MSRVPTKKAWPGFIKSLREQHNLTQVQFAKVIRVTPQTIANWENGRSFPTRFDAVVVMWMKDRYIRESALKKHVRLPFGARTNVRACDHLLTLLVNAS